MALETGPEADLLHGLYHRQLEKSTVMQKALPPHHADQVHRKKPQSHSRLKALVSDVLEDQQQHSLIAQKKGLVKNRAIPVAAVKTKMMGDGRPKARAQEAQKCAFQARRPTQWQGKKR